MSPQYAAGILANIEAESLFNPTAVGDNGTSGGLFQHHASRWTNLRNFAASTGRSWTSWTAQVDFAIKEARAMGLNLQGTSATAASKEWTLKFERPANASQKAIDRARSVDRYLRLAVPTGQQPTPQPTGDTVANRVHVVKAGETLSEIAARSNMKLSTLIRRNPQIADPDIIQVGDVINIEPPGQAAPAPPAPQAPAAGGTEPDVRFHRVRAGETLSEIAQRSNITLPFLIALNPQIEDPDVIRPGDIVKLEPPKKAKRRRKQQQQQQQGPGPKAKKGKKKGQKGKGPKTKAAQPRPGADPTRPQNLPGVLNGGRTIRVGKGKQKRFFQIYEFPPGSGNFIAYQFNNRRQVVAALGQDFDVTTRSDTWFDNRVIAEAAAEEVIGQQGNFRRITREIMEDAATAAGVDDPTLVGRIASNREMQQVMAQAVIGNWTPRQIRAAQRQTSFWKNQLFPGIENLYDRTEQPERAWRQYRQEVSGALSTLGYTRDADGTFNSQIRRMLNLNIDSNVFLSQVPTFVKATQNRQFAGTLRRWAVRELGESFGATFDFNDWFKVVAGRPQPELERVVERAQLAFEAQRAGLRFGRDITEAQVRRLGRETQLSAQQAQQVFSQFAQGVLALGQAGLQRAGLTESDVLFAAAGVGPRRGDRTVEEIKLKMAQVARENALFDEDKIDFFVGFTPSGVPERPGLRALAPEAGG